MIKALAITDKGLEKVSALEIKELIDVNSKEEDSCVSFSAGSYEDLFRLIYFTQSNDRIITLFAEFEFENYDELLEKAKDHLSKFDLKDWITENSSFKVECERRGLHDFGSNMLEQEVGGIILEQCKEKLGFEPKVELKRPDLQVYAFINHEKAYFGIDFCGKDLSKREYRIFTAPGIINAKLAYAIVRLSDYSKKKKMVDLYSKAGIVAIEAAMHENHVSAHKYSKDFFFNKLAKFKDFNFESLFKKFDSEKKEITLDITGFDPILRNLEAAKKNAKLAGVDKMIKFSKMDLEWVDSKLGESEVDLVISRIPVMNHALSESQVRKVYKELFYQAEFFLKGNGRLCVLAENLLTLREMLTKEFQIISEDHLWAGQAEYEFIVLERIKKK